MRVPLAPLPHRSTGCVLPLDLPRPPPCGWSVLCVVTVVGGEGRRGRKSQRKKEEEEDSGQPWLDALQGKRIESSTGRGRPAPSNGDVNGGRTHAFIATPRLCGLKPNHLIRPALPKFRC